jgi:hypothetical protein
MSRNELWCPTCENMVPHDRGYLKEHYVQKHRGQLVTGNRMCDGSNTKPQLDLRKVTFQGTCPNCLALNRVEFTEKFPGSLEQYGGVLTQNCTECGPEGTYCTDCDHLLHEETVKVGAPVVPGQAQAELEASLKSMGMDQAAIDQFLASGSLPTSTPTTPGDLLSQMDTSGVTDVKVWFDHHNNDECPTTSVPHQPVHRDQQDRPVVLTDNHVIKEIDND